jgi:nucleoside diphosphate kinase
MASDITQERQQTRAPREGEHAMNDARQHAHELIDRMPETQISALVGLLETIVARVKELKGKDGEKRLRVGNFRVRFTEEGDQLSIHAVKDRKDVYR